MSVELPTLQNWMQNVIVDPRSDDDVQHDHEKHAEKWVRPTEALTAYERVSIYRDMYLLRMEEALQADFTALAHYLGQHRFDHLVADYVKAYPSVSYNLSRLSDHLPEFIKTWPMLKGGKLTFCTDLARLELTVTQIFDAPFSPSLDSLDLFSVPQDAWDRARLVPVHAFALHAFDYPVNDYLDAVMREQDTPPVRKQATCSAVWRHGYEMKRTDLTKTEFRVLSALVEGKSLFDAFTLATNGRGRVAPEAALDMFTRWIRSGMFREIQID